jgi:pimeloyl-ACP methyl ester carboxylesterase
VRLLYTHGLGGTPEAQPEIDSVFAPLGYAITRVAVRFHQSMPELVTRLASATFGDLCNWVNEGANDLIAAAGQSSPGDYVVVGDSLGGFISAVAAQRDPRISHCILLACSGDFCDAMMRLHTLNPVLSAITGILADAQHGGIEVQAHRAISGNSDFQREFELINTFEPQRLARLRRLLILGDKRDPVAPERACLHFARGVADATVRMVYDEGHHHPIGKEALERYAVPFLRNQPVPDLIQFTAQFSAKDRAAAEGSSIKAGFQRILRRLRPRPGT